MCPTISGGVGSWMRRMHSGVTFPLKKCPATWRNTTSSINLTLTNKLLLLKGKYAIVCCMTNQEHQTGRAPLFLTVPEAMATLRIGKTSLYAEIKAGRLAAVKYGSKTLILANSVQLFAQYMIIEGQQRLDQRGVYRDVA